jgi:hypothetical protein
MDRDTLLTRLKEPDADPHALVRAAYIERYGDPAFTILRTEEEQDRYSAYCSAVVARDWEAAARIVLGEDDPLG